MQPAYGQLHTSQANLALQASWGTQQAQSQSPAGDVDLAQDLCEICIIKHFYSMSWSRSQEQLLLCQ